MRMTSALLAVSLTALAFIPTAAQAQDSIPASGIYKNSQQIMDLCTSAKSGDVDKCEFFLMGAHDTIIYFQDIGELDKSICVPAGTDSAVLRQVAVDYWRANPASRKFSAVSTFWNALVARYPAPCK